MLWRELRQIQKDVVLKADAEEVDTALKKKVEISGLNRLMDKEIRPALLKKAELV